MFKMEIVNEGWVFKQSKYLKRLRKRYMILTKNFICSFKSEYYQGEKPTEVISKKKINYMYMSPNYLEQLPCRSYIILNYIDDHFFVFFIPLKRHRYYT